MSRPSAATKTMPANALDAVKAMGEHLRIARERRRESLRAWAARMNISVPTLRRMESGDPTVGMGVYATALWLCGQEGRLGGIMAPETDSMAQEMDIVRASRRRK